MTKERPTQSRVLELLRYDELTGLFTWRVDRNGMRMGDVAGTLSERNGWIISVDGKQYKAHHLAWLIVHGIWPALIDHRDGDKRNNAICNLRKVSQKVNVQNMRRAMRTNKSSGLLGVSASRSAVNPWKSQIRIGGVITHLGSFPTAESAHAAYVAAKRLHHEGCTL